MVPKLRLVFSITILFVSFYGFAQRNYWKQERAGGSLKQALLKQHKIRKGTVFVLGEDRFKQELKTSESIKTDTARFVFPMGKGSSFPLR